MHLPRVLVHLLALLKEILDLVLIALPRLSSPPLDFTTYNSMGKPMNSDCLAKGMCLLMCNLNTINRCAFVEKARSLQPMRFQRATNFEEPEFLHSANTLVRNQLRRGHPQNAPPDVTWRLAGHLDVLITSPAPPRCHLTSLEGGPTHHPSRHDKTHHSFELARRNHSCEVFTSLTSLQRLFISRTFTFLQELGLILRQVVS